MVLKKPLLATFLVLGLNTTAAEAVVVNAGETLRLDFDLSGFNPAYDPTAAATLSVSLIQWLTDAGSISFSAFNADGNLVFTGLTNCPSGCTGSGGTSSGTNILGAAPFYIVFEGLGGSVDVAAGFQQGENLVAGVVASPVPVPAALPLLASGLGALGFASWRRSKKNTLAA